MKSGLSGQKAYGLYSRSSLSRAIAAAAIDKQRSAEAVTDRMHLLIRDDRLTAASASMITKPDR